MQLTFVIDLCHAKHAYKSWDESEHERDAQNVFLQFSAESDRYMWPAQAG